MTAPSTDWPPFGETGCRISDEWTYKGLRTVILENDVLRVVILADRGSDIIEFRYKPYDVDFLLRRPHGIRSPQDGNLDPLGDTAFIDYFSGGWCEILPNGGGPSHYKGAALGQHGEISLIPWRCAITADSPARVAVTLSVRPYRVPFALEKTLALEAGKAALFIEERLTNEAGEPLHCMWGQHIAFGNPFLREGAIIHAPGGRFLVHEVMTHYEPRRFVPGSESVWPQAQAMTGGTLDASRVPAYGAEQAQEMAYLTDLTDGWYAITGARHHVGFGLRFDHNLYRYLWYWQQLGDAAQGYPWWKRLHTMALEPWTSYPTNGLAEAVENGTALLLQPGQTVEARLCAVAFSGIRRVTNVTASGEVEGE
jgi:galactose mutarotase-like enzyme